MAALIPFPIEQPGVAGLNKEGRNTVLGPEWATKINNLVIDNEGRLALRKGTRALADVTLDGTIQVTWALRTGAGVAQRYCATSNGTVYEFTGGAWVSVFTGLADGNVQFANVDGIAHFVHTNEARVQRQPSTGANFVDITTAPLNARALMGMYGRLWVMTDAEIYVSALLDTTAPYTLSIDPPVAA